MNNMNRADVTLFVKAVAPLGKQFDYELLIHGLFKQGFITQHRHDRLQEMLNETKSSQAWKQKNFLSKLAESVSVDSIAYVLRDIGLDDVAEGLASGRNESLVKVPTVIPCENEQLIGNVYMTLQSKRANNTVTVNIQVDFQNMTDFFISKLHTTREVRLRQRFLDCLSVIVRMRGFILDTFPQYEAVLKEFANVRADHTDLDQTVSNVLYLVSQVYVARERGSLDEAATWLCETRQAIHGTESPFLRFVIDLAEQAFYRTMYANTKAEDHLNKSLVICDNAISRCSIASCVDNPTIFLQLSKVLTLLGCFPNFEFDFTYRVPAVNAERAKNILRHISPFYQGLQNTDKVFYRVGMARAYEQENIKLALANAEMALQLGCSSNCIKREKQNIAKYIDYLKSFV